MNKIIRQHETLRVPQGWKEQDRALVIQMERILDDLYLRLGKIESALTNGVVSAVDFDTESKAITVTINGEPTVVVSAEGLKEAMAPFTWGQLANK